jgi:hypothetical protein
MNVVFFDGGPRWHVTTNSITKPCAGQNAFLSPDRVQYLKLACIEAQQSWLAGMYNE